MAAQLSLRAKMQMTVFLCCLVAISVTFAAARTDGFVFGASAAQTPDLTNASATPQHSPPASPVDSMPTSSTNQPIQKISRPISTSRLIIEIFITLFVIEILVGSVILFNCLYHRR